MIRTYIYSYMYMLGPKRMCNFSIRTFFDFQFRMFECLNTHTMDTKYTNLYTIYAVIFEGLIFCGKQVCKDFCGSDHQVE